MVIDTTNKTVLEGTPNERTVQRLADDANGRPIFACMYENGQTQLIEENLTEQDSPITHVEGVLKVPQRDQNGDPVLDENGDPIYLMDREAFGVIIEDGARILDGAVVIDDTDKVATYWAEFVNEITQVRGLSMPA